MSIFLFKPDRVFEQFLKLENVSRFDPRNSVVGDSDFVVCQEFLHFNALKALIHGDFELALQNDNNGQANPISHEKLNFLLETPNSVLFIYNSWETRNLYEFRDKLETYVRDYIGLPMRQVVFSVPDYRNHMKRCGNVISYDWVFVNEKRLYSSSNIVDNLEEKLWRVISLNRNVNKERYSFCRYLFRKHEETAIFSYLGDRTYSRWSKRFNSTLPSVLDDLNPDWYELGGVSEFLANSLALVTMETNQESKDCEIQQISEKSYKGIKAGMPFLVFTTRGGVLRHLQDLGFKTFAPLINESYDDPTFGYRKRFKMLLRETSRICNLSDAEAKEFSEKVRPIIEHNLAILHSLSNLPNIFSLLGGDTHTGTAVES